jgi:tetratricopeptide (TPR) repeat protein
MAVGEALLLKSEAATDRDPKYLEALALFSKSLDLAQRRGELLRILNVQIRLADALLRAGRFDEAAVHFAAAKEQIGDHADRLKALSLKPLDIEHNLAICFLKLGKIPEARSALENILLANPRHSEAIFTKAQLDLQDGIALRYGAGSQEAEASALGQSLVKQGIATLESLRETLLAEDPRSPKSQDGEGTRKDIALYPRVASELGRAYVLLQHESGGMMRALPIAEDLIRRYPKRSEGYALRATIREQVNEDKALVLEDLLFAVRGDPKNVDYLLRCSVLLQSVGENRRARDFLARCRQLAPDSEKVAKEFATFMLRMAHNHRQAGTLELGLIAAREAATADPESPEAHLMIAEILLGRKENKDWEGAKESLERVLDLAPGHPEASSLLGGYFQARGIRSLSEMERQIRRFSDEEQAEVRRAIEDSIINDFRRALVLDPGAEGMAIARNYLKDHVPEQRAASVSLMETAEARLGAGDKIDAIELFKQAVRVDGSNVEARWLLADLLHAETNTQAASEHLTLGLAIDPEHLPSLALAVRVFYVLGEEKKVVQLASRFLRLSEPLLPNATLAKERERIEKIRALIN